MKFLDFFTKLRRQIVKRFRLFFLFFELHRLARLYFFIFFIIPVLTAFFFAVVLQFFLHPDAGISEVKPPLSGKKAAPVLREVKDSDELRNLLDQLQHLEIERNVLMNQIQMAKSDSIGLYIDLVDSIVALQIKGVNVRECKIQRFEISPAIKHLKAKGTLINWLETPFTLEQEYATLPKAPIKIVTAPKDTIEANERKTEPPVIEKSDVQIKLLFSRSLVVEIKQLEAPSAVGHLRNFYHTVQTKVALLREMLAAYLKLQPYQVALRIELDLSQADSKAIYRALPQHAALALRLPF